MIIHNVGKEEGRINMPVEVSVRDEYIAIYIDKKRLAGWLQGNADAPVPWEEGNNERDKSEDNNQGYVTGDGTKKDFPNPVDKKEQVDNSEVEGINLFDEGPTGQKGALQDAPNGKDKIKELRDWIKDRNFNYRNFCQFLFDMKEVAGFQLSTPLIGVTKQKKEPTLLQVAYRFYSYWLSAKEEIARQYKGYLLDQLEDMGITIQMVEKELDGKEIDPKNLPKGIEVSV